ncbi:hypothetical protein H1235_15365 [Pseudoxanthomonas sp. NC8]|nr:hypothetical protein H1235_15365 [Pseudoxanthomonas sp. NC8]
MNRHIPSRLVHGAAGRTRRARVVAGRTRHAEGRRLAVVRADRAGPARHALHGAQGGDTARTRRQARPERLLAPGPGRGQARRQPRQGRARLHPPVQRAGQARAAVQPEPYP